MKRFPIEGIFLVTFFTWVYDPFGCKKVQWGVCASVRRQSLRAPNQEKGTRKLTTSISADQEIISASLYTVSLAFRKAIDVVYRQQPRIKQLNTVAAASFQAAAPSETCPGFS